MNRPRKGKTRFLPKYVCQILSQHGTVRYRFRRAGQPARYFTSTLGTTEFQAEYQSFMDETKPKIEAKPHSHPGSLNSLLDRYMSVPERIGPTEITQSKIRAVLEDFREGRGDRMVSQITFEAVEKIVAKKMIKTGSGNKTKGGPHAATKLRKELIRLFDFAIKLKMLDHNPARLAARVKMPANAKTGGFHTWTEEEIDQFRGYHKLGTRQRLAMELMLWTDQRRSDAVTMSKAQIKDGRLPILQEKTGATLWVPVAPQLLEAIVAMAPKDTSPDCFLITEKTGRPFKTAASFGVWFKKACVDAGLPHCTSHGLRKATLRRMAELQMSNSTMKSLSGQRSDKTLAIYTEKANQTLLADAAMETLSAWERSVQDANKCERRA